MKEAAALRRFRAMQLFAVRHRASRSADGAVAAAVVDAAKHFPALADGDLELGSTDDGRLEFAAWSHPAEIAAPRRYSARHGDVVVLYDGLPIARRGGFAAWDAGELLRRWDDLPEALEGIFCALRIDLARGRVECLPDVLGMAHVYLAGAGDDWIISNSLAAIRVAGRIDEPDPLGVASLLTLGWPICGSTPLAGVRLLPGGHTHELDATGLRSHETFTPRLVAPRRRRGRPPRSAADVAGDMAATTASAGREVAPLVCGVTAGRDTRVLMALARAGGWDASYYTSGHEDDTDVRFARKLTSDLGLPFELITPELPDSDEEWLTATARFVAQTDGMATLQGIDDWVDHQAPVDALGLKLWGPGGEIGRAGNIGLAIPFVANTFGLRWSEVPQRWVLRHKARRWDLVRPEALETTRAALDAFARTRLDEGWRPREILEAYYAFERVPHWAAGGVRRAASSTDLFSPFVSRDYIAWCFSLSSGERVVEAPPWRLLSELAPDLRDMPFEHEWRPQRPEAAQAMVLRDVALHAGAGLRTRLRPSPHSPARPKYGARWLERGRALHRDLCLSQESSPLWEMVDRRALERALADADPQAPRHPRYWIWLCHAVTAFWWFHGREAALRTPLPALR